MKPLRTLLVAFLLLATGAVHAEIERSGTYTGSATGTSSGEVLWSQLDEPTGSGWTVQAFETAYAGYDSLGADDFRLVGATYWEFESLFIPGSMTEPGAHPAFVNVAFYEDFFDVPGSVVESCEFPANTNFALLEGELTIDVSGCRAYREGFYPTDLWFSLQVRMDFFPSGQHWWATRVSANGDPGVWKNPENAWGNGCLNWLPMNATCGVAGKDWMFELSGEPIIEDPLGVPAIGPFGVVVLVLALGGGGAHVLRRRR